LRRVLVREARWKKRLAASGGGRWPSDVRRRGAD
jgi:hypothetical protein